MNSLSTWEVGEAPLDNPRAAEAVELSKQGLSQRQIADKLGCSASAVNNYLKAA
ncbi:MAG: helix-turn-helix domain-containing protein [Alphaproteobacteria bacterium]